MLRLLTSLLGALMLAVVAPALADDDHGTHAPGIDKAPQRLGLGDQWPAVEVLDAEGEKVALDSFNDQPTLFVFYMGSTCAGCLQQLIELGQMSDKFAAAGAEIVAVSADDLAGVRKTRAQLEKAGVTSVTILGDPELVAIEALGTRIPGKSQSFHSVFLVDREGMIRLVARGDMAPVNLPSPAVLLLELKKMNTAERSDR